MRFSSSHVSVGIVTPTTLAATPHGGSGGITLLLLPGSPENAEEAVRAIQSRTTCAMAATATYQVQPPEGFNFSRPEEWQKWIRRFERFRIVSGLSEKTGETQVNALVYAMGEEAEDILRSFGLSADDSKKYDVVKAKFDGHFVKRRNVIYERAKFNQRRQEQGETVDSFITALYGLAEHCGYAGLHDEMIRDRIVVGLRDAKLSENLQLDPELTLDKAVTKARQSEMVKQQQLLVRDGSSTASGNHKQTDTHLGVVKYKGRRGQPRMRQRTDKQNSDKDPKPDTCGWCGKSPPHKKQQCPAKDMVCHKCNKRGHFQSVCRSVHELHAETDSDADSDSKRDSPFLGVVTSKEEGSPWSITISVDEQPVEFEIDTGAEVTVISTKAHKKLGRPTLSTSNKTLHGPSNKKLPVKGQFKATLKCDSKAVEQDLYVVDKLHKHLLGRPAIEALNVVTRVREVRGSDDPLQQYPELFRGLGKLEGDYSIKLEEGAEPYSLTVPRRVAIPLMKPVKEELNRMEKLGVITRVEQPTEWCAAMVVVPKSNGKVRICVDLTHLNRSVRRERHPLPAVEQSLAQLAGAKVFSTLDANSGFWQIPLNKGSALLTTFITPFGRYCFHRLPFGITSAPEHFQRRMSDMLCNLEGVVCMMDDVLVHGRMKEEHDRRLDKVLQRMQEVGLTLNEKKCQFSRNQVKFLGQVIDQDGVHPDDEKVRAIQRFKKPQNVGEIRRFLGMCNHLSKFAPHLAEKTKPLRDLLNKSSQWVWDHPQQTAFEEVKGILATSPVLALFDQTRETVVSADASSYGLGAVLLQKQPDGELKPISYISRSLTPTEQRYAQIEKEALAFTWACERFADYLLGMDFHIHTDHKPLVPLFGVKNLDELPIRVQRFRLRMMRYKFTISHVPGTSLLVADALSRAPCSDALSTDVRFQKKTEVYVDSIVQNLPATEKQLIRIQRYQEEDVECQEAVRHTQSGWPSRQSLYGPMKRYLDVATELSVKDGLLMRGSRIVIPTALRLEMLDRIHTGHQGIFKCRERARQSIWWPGLSRQLEELVKNCTTCRKFSNQRSEPLIPTSLPELPWQRVGTDLFEMKGYTYLLVVDYYSRYIEVARLNRTTAEEVIHHTKSMFARHGTPEVVVSDNGPQYSSEAYADFAREFQFQHVTSSPHYPQSNGEAERAVQTVKNLMKKDGDPYLAMLSYRSTPLKCGFSPSELLMSRKLRTNLPMTRELLKPSVPDPSLVRKREKQLRERTEDNYNKRHGVRELEPLSPGQSVWIPDRNEKALVLHEAGRRSYEVQTTEGGVYRRNRRALIELPDPDPIELPEIDATEPNSNTTPANQDSVDPNRSSNETNTDHPRRSTRESQAPKRLDPSWT